jgi:hypothetical protein
LSRQSECRQEFRRVLENTALLLRKPDPHPIVAGENLHSFLAFLADVTSGLLVAA